jgi:hypothetical protein
MTNIELKNALRALEARVKVLEESKPLGINAQSVETKPKKLCPKCNKAPAYFFHVKNCPG